MFGQWERDPRLDDPGREPFEIAMQGLGLFACRRSAWPGLNPRLRGFGGEEGYLHERFRRRGGRVLCHPRLGWAHRFARPIGIPYPNRCASCTTTWPSTSTSAARIADGTYRAVITSPRVASQPNLLDTPDGDGALGARYVI